MPDKFSASASTISAKDYKSKEHSVTEFTVTEELSKPFEIVLTLVSSSFEISSQIGQKLTVNRYDNESGSLKLTRSYNGIITNIRQVGLDDSLQYASYEVTLRPWLWLLTHTHSFRVYQSQSTKDIVSDIFTSTGFSGSFKVNSLPSTKREYCLQYNESDFDFVSRLLSEEGIHYYFEHSDGDHTLVLQDAKNPFSKSDISKFDMAETRSGSNPIIEKWMPTSDFHGVSIELSAYDYSQTKLVSSKASKSSNSVGNNSKLAAVHYPTLGIVGDTSDLASNLVKRRIAEIEQCYSQVIATSKNDYFYVGTTFSLSSHLDKSQLGDFLVIKTRTQYLSLLHITRVAEPFEIVVI